MENKTISAKIEKDKDMVSLAFAKNLPSIELSEKTTDDLTKFFNKLFDFIVDQKALVKIELEKSESKDIFQETAEDIINQLNNEITSSKDNFVELWKLSE
jgi:hypothetical protein